MGIDLLVDEALEGLLDFQVFVGELHSVSHPSDARRKTQTQKPWSCACESVLAKLVAFYIRATPNCMGRSCRAAASAQMARHCPSTARVSRGSITPSSSISPDV